MRRMIVVKGLALWMVLLASGGCTASRAAEGERMYVLASALTKVCDSVEATVRYENPPEGITDNELLILSTQHDPGLLEPFAAYTLHVSREDAHAVVIVCGKDEKVGLLEDAGCSSEMDRHLWKEDPTRPCKITLKAKEACPEPGIQPTSFPASQGNAASQPDAPPAGQADGDRRDP